MSFFLFLYAVSKFAKFFPQSKIFSVGIHDKPGSVDVKFSCFIQKFGQEAGKGFIILSCELIDDNGKELEKCVLKYAEQWNLGEDFINWIKAENIFCSTLVDRIVTGYPRNEAAAICEELGYEDNLIDTGEIFGFWVIEGPQSIKDEFPVDKANLPILITDNHKPYKQRKVRILNGAHTSFVLGAYLAGQDIVRDCMNDDVICGFMNKTIYDEIIPTLDLPKTELENFAAAVTERFKSGNLCQIFAPEGSIGADCMNKIRCGIIFMCKVEFENCLVIFYSVFISCSFGCKSVFAHSISVIECNVEGERSCDACRKCTFAFYIFFE